MGDRGSLNELAEWLYGMMVKQAEKVPATADLNQTVEALVEREAGLLSQAERELLVDLVAKRAFGLGPLESLMADPEVDEIMVNGPSSVWVERAGMVERAAIGFPDEAALKHTIERILAPLGRRVDESEPLVDARLHDGSRVNVVIPPLALDGPVLTVRRFRHGGFTPQDLVDSGTITAELHDFLARCVSARLNILISGGTGSGKTTTLGAIASFIPDSERIVTIEDAAELRLPKPHVVRLEARPANVEGRGEVTIRRLVRNALRMRPDRIVVGEVRGAEALDMLSAMSTGHDGSLGTVHASSSLEALKRLETLVLMADVGLPHAAVRDQIAYAIDLVVHQARLPDGSRKVVTVSEVVRSGDYLTTNDLYTAGTGKRGLDSERIGPLLAERQAG